MGLSHHFPAGNIQGQFTTGKKRSPCEPALEETQAERPALTAQILMSKTNMSKMALTITIPTNFIRWFWGIATTCGYDQGTAWGNYHKPSAWGPTPDSMEVKLGWRRAALPGLAFCQGVHVWRLWLRIISQAKQKPFFFKKITKGE